MDPQFHSIQSTTQLKDIIIQYANLTSRTPPSFTEQLTIFYPGGFTTNETLTLNHIIQFDAQGNPNAQFFVHANQLIFSNGQIELLNDAQDHNIFWFADQDISCPDNEMILVGHFCANGHTNIANRDKLIGRIYDNDQIDSDHATKETVSIPCYLKGTHISTRRGSIPIEKLQIGDLIITRGDISGIHTINRVTRYRPIRWIGHFTIKNPATKVLPICIKKGTLGNHSDLYVSPDHNLILHGKLVPAQSLIDHYQIDRVKPCQKVKYYHFELERHSVIIAEGILSESYINVNNKGTFLLKRS